MARNPFSFRLFKFLKNFSLLFLIYVSLVSPLSGMTGIIDEGKTKSDSVKQRINIFGSEEVLDVTLMFNLSGFQKKSEKAGPFDGTFIFHPGQPDSVSMKVSVKHRGEYRFQTCTFPPIQLNFKKPVYASGDTGKIKKIKLVTHCNPGSGSDDYVMREYLVYKLYSVLTDTSFRVRLLKINYIDTEKKRKPVTQYGIFIEPKEILAARTNTIEVKAENLSQRHIIPGVMDRVAIFNYMIANWDWSVPGQHNISVFKSKISQVVDLGIAVPYDFDLCGVVNANYGTPAPEMGLTSSRDRKFTGICRDRQTIEDELKYFMGKKEQFYSVVNEFPLLSQRSKKDITGFLDQFFDRFENQKEIDNLVKEFLENCKKL
jgi:hypothetical protein